MNYLEAVGVESLRKVVRSRDRFLVWLSQLNSLLPYELHLSDTEIEQLASFLEKSIEEWRVKK